MFLDGIRHLAATARAFSPDTRRFLAGFFLVGIASGASGAHLNVYLAETGFDGVQIGRVVSAAAVGVVVVSLPAAVLAERVRPGRIFALGAAGFALALTATALFPHPWLAIALAFTAGALGSLRGVASGPFFVQAEHEDRRTELFGIASATESAATVVAAWATGAFAGWLGTRLGAEALGLRWALVAAAVPAAAAVVPFLRIEAPAGGHPRSWRDYVFARERALVFRLTAPSFVIGLGAGLTIPFLNLYFRDRFAQGPAEIGLYFSVAQVLMMAGFLAGPLLARRVGHVATVVWTELLSIPFFLALAVTSSLPVAVLAFWMRGALMNMNNPVVAAFAMSAVPPDQRTVTNSLRSFSWNVSWMVSSVAGGWLIEHHGFAPGMYATIGLYLVAAGMFWRFFRPPRP